MKFFQGLLIIIVATLLIGGIFAGIGLIMHYLPVWLILSASGFCGFVCAFVILTKLLEV